MKQYNNPTTEVVNLLTEQVILSESPVVVPPLHFEISEGSLDPGAAV